MTQVDKRIKEEIAWTGGTLEWASDRGVGVSFPRGTTDDTSTRIPCCIQYAAWISWADTGVTDLSIPILARAAVLKNLNLSGTRVTAAGIRQLLERTATIWKLEVSAIVNRTEVQRFRTQWPKVEIIQGDEVLT